MSHNVTVAPRAAFASKENKQDGGLAVNFVTKLLMEENLIYQNNIIIIETMSKNTTNRIWAPSAKKKRKEKLKCETNSQSSTKKTYLQSNGRETMSKSWAPDRELN